MDEPYGYCGMPCALCTRYRTAGTSRCPGCSCGGYYTEGCRVYRCCREKALAHCGECAEFPCARLGGMGDFRDLDTGHVKPRTCRFVAEHGFAAWQREYGERAAGADAPRGSHHRFAEGGRQGLSGSVAGKNEMTRHENTEGVRRYGL